MNGLPSAQHIVEAAAEAFEADLRRELRKRLMPLAEAEVEHTIDEIIQALQLRANGHYSDLMMGYEVTINHRRVE